MTHPSTTTVPGDLATHQVHPSRGRRWVWPLIIFVLALGLRLAYIQQTQDLAGFRTYQPGLDLNLHWQAARELRQGPDGSPRFALVMPSAPFFPAWLALSQSVLGEESPTPHRIPLAILGAITALLVFLIVRQIRRQLAPAAIAGLIAAVYPATVYFDTRLIKVAPELCLLAALILLLLRFGRGSGNERTPRALLGAASVGCVLAVLMTSQLATILFACVALCFIATQASMAWSKRLCAMAIVFAMLAVSAWTMASLKTLVGAEHSVFVPQSGIHLRLGYHAGANGTYSQIPGIPSYPFGHTFIARLEAERATKTDLTPAEADRFHRDLAIDFVKEHLGAASRLVARKTFLFLNNHELRSNEYLPDLKRRTPLLAWLPGSYGLLWIFSTWGFIALWRARKRRIVLLLAGVLLAVLAANVATFVTWRYRIHAVVPLFVLSGIGMAALWERARDYAANRSSNELKALLLHWIAPALVVGVLVYLPPPASLRTNMKTITEQNQHVVSMAEEWTKELAHLPVETSDDSGRAFKRVMLLRRLHRHSEAYRELVVLTTRTKDVDAANGMLLEYFSWLGERSKARDFLKTLGPKRSTNVMRNAPPPIRLWAQRAILQGSKR